MMSTGPTPAPALPHSAPPPAAPPRLMTNREKNLSSAKVWAVILILLGIANGVGGTIAGAHIKRTAYNFLGDPDGTEVSPTGWAFIANALAVGLILVLAGAIVICFANALKPERP